MATESAYGVVTRSGQVEAAEIRQSSMHAISLGLLLLGFLATTLLPPDDHYWAGRYSVYVSLLVEGIVAYWASSRYPVITRGSQMCRRPISSPCAVLPNSGGATPWINQSSSVQAVCLRRISDELCHWP